MLVETHIKNWASDKVLCSNWLLTSTGHFAPDKKKYDLFFSIWFGRSPTPRLSCSLIGYSGGGILQNFDRGPK